MCTLCSNRFSFHGGTSNLQNHLQRSHSAIYVHDTGQPKIDSVIKVQKVSPARAKILDNLIVGPTIHNLRPAQMVKGLGFQQLIKYCKPRYTVPSRKHTVSARLFLINIRMVKLYLPTNSLSLSLTTDLWTSSSTKDYISFTCHFLTSEWEFVDCVLATRLFPDHHTGENNKEGTGRL